MNPAVIIAEMKQDAAKYGNKAAADLAFAKLGLGLEVLVFDPSVPLEDIRQAVSDRFGFKPPLLVRFSKQNEIDLPIAIGSKTETQFVEFLSKNRGSDYAVIVRPLTDYKNAFELYYDGTVCHVNVIPGMWDVTVKEPVDLITVNPASIDIFQYQKPRRTKGLDTKPGKTADKIPLTELESLGLYVHSVRHLLDALLSFSDPVFVRGYQQQDGKVIFSNFRPSDAKYLLATPPARMHLVRTRTDLDDWNKTDPVYFDLAAINRKQDHLILELAEEMKKRGITKAFCNSFLSHQAILLRETGIETVQALDPAVYVSKKIVLRN
jgi:hypothetical protein